MVNVLERIIGESWFDSLVSKFLNGVSMKYSTLSTVITLCLLLLIPACRIGQINGENVPEDSPSLMINALLDQGMVKEALELVGSHGLYFTNPDDDGIINEAIHRLSDAVRKKYSPKLQELQRKIDSVHWPAPIARWADVKQELNDIGSELKSINSILQLENQKYRPERLDQVNEAFKTIKNRIRGEAPLLFASYPLENGINFFAIYPVLVDVPKVLATRERTLDSALSVMSQSQLESVFSIYGSNLSVQGRKMLAEIYFWSLCPEGKDSDLKVMIAAYKKCCAVGMELKSIPGIKVAFLQVTSPDLIKDKVIDFGLSIKLDMPFNASRASMRKAFSHDAVKEADILILVNMAVSKATRVVGRNEIVHSLYVAEHQAQPNAEYEIVKSELDAASMQYLMAMNRKATSWVGSAIDYLTKGYDADAAITEAGETLESVREKLRKTNKTTMVPVYESYPVIKAHMDIYKDATVNYYIVDKRKRLWFRDTFDINEKAFFTVCYDMQESDPNRLNILQTSVLEEDVVRHEIAPVPVNISDLFEQFTSRPEQWSRYATMGDIQRQLSKDRSVAQAQKKQNDFGYDKYLDKRFESVVVVRNSGKGVGTGFYVTEEHILTNYHVVEENEYVQLKLFNQRELMGRVIARDALLDLAIIEADFRGKPVCFYNKRTLPLGDPVEVIGHPDGFEFSITRGVISTIRKRPPINLWGANAEVLYIQTDASTNGGNSGGPVFYGNVVVGVHDWGRKLTQTGNTAHGLSFSIHYSEIFKFFDRNGIMVCKGSR